MVYTIKPEHLAAISGATTSLMPALADWMNQTCPTYEIDTPQEYCHFLAQACHETDHFRTLREHASGSAYEGRTDLGNTQPGDGVKFKGRGISKLLVATTTFSWESSKVAVICSSTNLNFSSNLSTQYGVRASTGKHAAYMTWLIIPITTC